MTKHQPQQCGAAVRAAITECVAKSDTRGQCAASVERALAHCYGPRPGAVGTLGPDEFGVHGLRGAAAHAQPAFTPFPIVHQGEGSRNFGAGPFFTWHDQNPVF